MRGLIFNGPPLMALLLFLLFSTGCRRSETNTAYSASPSPSTTPDAASQVALDEDIFQATSYLDPSARAEARKTAIDYVHAMLPDWSIKGLSAQFYEGTVYASVDIRRENKTATLALEVRKFFPDAGDAYWKAEPYKRSLEQQIKGVLEQ